MGTHYGCGEPHSIGNVKPQQPRNREPKGQLSAAWNRNCDCAGAFGGLYDIEACRSTNAVCLNSYGKLSQPWYLFTHKDHKFDSGPSIYIKHTDQNPVFFSTRYIRLRILAICHDRTEIVVVPSCPKPETDDVDVLRLSLLARNS